jgi:hypothetical protein
VLGLPLYGYESHLYGDSIILYGAGELCTREPALIHAWSTGGMQGGSCWGGEPHYYATPSESEPEWEMLDQILEFFCPNLSFLRYKGIMRLVNTADYSEGEYYGNPTNYSIKILKLATLWEYLNENKLIEKDEVKGDSNE